MDDLIRRITRLRTGGKESKIKGEEVTEEDVVRSIKQLGPLGCGYEVLELGGKRMVRSVPRELDTDTMVVLAMLMNGGVPWVTEESLVEGQRGRGWGRERARAVLETMALREGMLWVDEQAFPVRYYSLATLPTA